MNSPGCVKALRPNLKIIEGSQRATPTVQTHVGEGGAGMIHPIDKKERLGGWKRLIVLPLCVCLLTACSARKPVLSVGVSRAAARPAHPQTIDVPMAPRWRAGSGR